MKKDADSYSRKIEIDLERGLHIAPGASITVNRLAEEYLATMDQRAASKAITKAYAINARYSIKKHFLPRIGQIIVSELSRSDVAGLVADVVAVTSLSPRRSRHVLKQLSLMLDYGVRREYMTLNHLPIVMKDYRGGQRLPVRTFQREDVRVLMKALETAPVHKQNGTSLEGTNAILRCAVYMAVFCGLRVGEVLGLTWENLDMDERIIRVRHSLSSRDGLKGPKTRSGIRDVPMPDIVVGALQTWQNHARKPLTGPAFVARFGKPLSYVSFHECYWHPLLERAGLDKPDAEGRGFHFHALRHFASSVMIDMNLPLPEVASLMGHNKFDMTLQVYAHTIVGGHRRHAAIEGAVQSLALEAPKASCADVTQMR